MFGIVDNSKIPGTFGKKYITMKKNLIYTLCILIGGAFCFSSCEDMLDVDSKRVQYDFGTLTANDTVYSVLGILKGVQQVADRHVLLGELRGDLLSTTDKAVVDIERIASFDREGESKYNSPKDYYAIINNCNLYLHRVDTSLEHSGKKLMMTEFVAVKSVRAWAYMQLALNYGRIPYFTEPILTHSEAEKVMKEPKIGIEELAPILIEELTPFEDPRVFPMPGWEGIKILNQKTALPTRQMFVPIRVLLGDLHLWIGNYKEAADFYYKVITEDNKFYAVSREIKVLDNNNDNDFTKHQDLYSPMYEIGDNANNITNSENLTVIPFEKSTSIGAVSELSSIFTSVSPSAIVSMSSGNHQVVASPALVGLSRRQTYLAVDYAADGKTPMNNNSFFYNTHENMKGDLRLYSTTFSQTDNETGEELNFIINKFNLRDHNIDNSTGRSKSELIDHTPAVVIYRSMALYLRFAEAVLGMAREDNVYGAIDLAMAVLASGASENHILVDNWSTTMVPDTSKPQIDEETGDTIRNEETGEILYHNKEIVIGDTISYDFRMLTDNKGVHSRGSGDSKYNSFYTMRDTCIARYNNELTVGEDGTKIYPEYTYADSLKYLANLIVDEMALELAFEGYRFTDLVRFAKALGDKDFLAKRVAGRDYENSLPYFDPEFELDNELYNRLKDERNWYLPLPGEDYIDVIDPEQPVVPDAPVVDEEEDDAPVVDVPGEDAPDAPVTE